MEHPLHFNPSLGCYEVGPTETQRKAALISDINIIQLSLNKECVGLSQFEELMEYPLSRLMEMVNDQAELLRRALAHKNSEPLDYE